ncbi:MAG: hypothetical protein EA376_03475 [Phycisphaeraceae bacterium]|nr:MAG: hypothetical protein EA376_03475 [Phycisphaeraceae bacterium]
MGQILIRGLDDETVRRLKERARQSGRSLQSEVKRLLQREANQLSIDEALERARRFRDGFQGREFDDSAELIRKDRDR